MRFTGRSNTHIVVMMMLLFAMFVVTLDVHRHMLAVVHHDVL